MDTRRRAARAMVFGVLLCWSAQASAKTQNEFVYTWKPRSSDVSSLSTGKDRLVLKSLLELVETTEYVVQPGESLDFIIRKTFLVSSQWGNAYSLYLGRIKQLNSELLHNEDLRPGQRLILPSGPQYGATELGGYLSSGKLKDQTFRRMSAKAYKTWKGTEAIRLHALKTLSHFVSMSKEGSSDLLFSRIQKRGLIAPVDVTAYPEETIPQIQPLEIHIRSAEQETSFQTLQAAEASGNLLPGLFPVSQTVNVPCSQCQSCAETLRVPALDTLSRARVLIEDTGINSSLLASSDNLIEVQGASDSGSDLSDIHHGTFVFSEVAALNAPNRKSGPLPKESVYVSRVARFLNGKLQFSMADIIRAWAVFADRMQNDNQAPNTWVVNLSAEGNPAPNTLPRPELPESSKLLIVAAAGNDSDGNKPADEAFGNLSNGGNPLLIVGATAIDGTKASYSNFNELNVQLFAQGDCVCGMPDQLSGTSQASPLVATAAAIVASRHPKWFPRQVMWRLLSTADSMPKEQAFAGRINLDRALDPYIFLLINTDNQQASQTEAVSVEFSADWAQKLADAEGPASSRYEILRLHQSRTIGNEVCFGYVRYLRFEHAEICVPATATISVVERGGVSKVLSATQVEDLQLPLNSERTSQLPRISVNSSTQ